jgi:hypothetical protein
VHIANSYTSIFVWIRFSNSLRLSTEQPYTVAGKQGKRMSKKPQSKDEALEALDFIVNVLKEHEKDLDKLIGELGTVTEQLGTTGDLTEKVETIEEKVSGLQNEISNLVNCLSTTPRETPITVKETKTTEPTQAPIAPTSTAPSTPVILRCKQWEDFLTLASQAHTMSFMVKEAERTFQVDALKGNQIITYNGELPKPHALLKVWLSKQLEIPEKKVLEGVLAIG